MSLTKIYKDWFQERDNPYRFWIPINKKDQDIQFTYILPYTRYILKLCFVLMTKPIDWEKFIVSNPSAFVTLIILIDQFYRTLAKKFPGFNKFKKIMTYLTYNIVKSNFELILKLIVKKKINSKEAIFLMMPYKHMIPYGILTRPGRSILPLELCSRRECGSEGEAFGSILRRRSSSPAGRSLIDIKPSYQLNELFNCKHYQKFYTDFAEKYYLNADITPSLEKSSNSHNKDYSGICEYFDIMFFETPPVKKMYDIDVVLENFVNNNGIKKICVSLSGGVDSMVMLYSLTKLNKSKKINIELVAFHLIYNNRDESRLEFDLISEYCTYLGIKLYYYHINYLKRNNTIREKYESLTRDIRFACYNTFDANICLGHIYDDYVENIITNFATNKHTNDLGKLRPIQEQKGVLVTRPFLNVKKNQILEYSSIHLIPFFLNTTPIWSNRGKFRNKFEKEIKVQYGEEVFNNMIKSTEKINSMSRIVENMVINPISKEFIENDEITITKKMLEEPYILKAVFENYFHNKNIGRPSDLSIQNLVNSIPGNQKIQMKKEISFRIIEYKIRLIN